MKDCCQNPNIQTFGPNEYIKTPTKVCVNCGRLIRDQDTSLDARSVGGRSGEIQEAY
jgi:hypothetical protein